MFEVMLGGGKKEAMGEETYIPTGPAGQEDFITDGSHTWTCPVGVYTVCCLLISKASGSSQTRGNNGGRVGYNNNIPVVPGVTYNIEVGIDTQAFGLSSETISPGFNGGSGYSSYTVKNSWVSVRSGGAGRFDGVGPKDNEGIDIITLLPSNDEKYGSSTSGSVYYDGKGNVYNWRPSHASPGAVRIIWGEGREYPSNYVSDVLPFP